MRSSHSGVKSISFANQYSLEKESRDLGDAADRLRRTVSSRSHRKAMNAVENRPDEIIRRLVVARWYRVRTVVLLPLLWRRGVQKCC